MTKDNTKKLEAFTSMLFTDTILYAILAINVGIWNKDMYEATVGNPMIHVHYNQFTKTLELTVLVDGYKD